MTRDPNQGPTGGATPHLVIPSGRGAEAIAFYEKAFGATERTRQHAEDGKRLMHAHLEVNGGSLMLHDEFPEYGMDADVVPKGVTIHLQVDDADAWWARAIQAGATETMPLADQFWGDRYGNVRDPFGHSWSIGSPVRD